MINPPPSPPFVPLLLLRPASVNSRKDKSLRVMSQKFVMLFLVSNPRVVSLDVAAKILIGEEQGANQDKNKFKSEWGNPGVGCLVFQGASRRPDLKRASRAAKNESIRIDLMNYN